MIKRTVQSILQKYLHKRRASFEHYFWRTTNQQEIDLIELENGALSAFEIKWNPAKKVSYPLSFTRAYPEAELISINPENYLHQFIKTDYKARKS